jgi:hypothetical protein
VCWSPDVCYSVRATWGSEQVVVSSRPLPHGSPHQAHPCSRYRGGEAGDLRMATAWQPGSLSGSSARRRFTSLAAVATALWHARAGPCLVLACCGCVVSKQSITRVLLGACGQCSSIQHCPSSLGTTAFGLLRCNLHVQVCVPSIGCHPAGVFHVSDVRVARRVSSIERSIPRVVPM